MNAIIDDTERTVFGPEGQAKHLFDVVYFQGWVSSAWSKALGKTNSLQDAASLVKGKKIASQYYQGCRKVSIGEIKGSEGRSADFDASFRPRKSHDRDRWVRVASAFIKGIGLPPVDLIKIGENYIVRDGHHRISVAKACGASSVDAYVTIWNVV
jgi:hypothetical protein